MASIFTKAFHRLHRELPTQRKLEELNWGQIFDSATHDSEWLVKRAFNPGRWAMGFPGLYILFRTLSETRPKHILEFGLGESSKLTHQYRSYYPDTGLTIIEQDSEWKEVFCQTVFDVSDAVRILPLKITGKGRSKHYSYQDLMPAINGKKYDFIIVDGPWGSRRNSRNQILDIIREGLLADEFIILVDDANRRGEADTIRQIQKLLKSQNKGYAKGFYRGRKDSCVICSSGYRFLTSL